MGPPLNTALERAPGAGSLSGCLSERLHVLYRRVLDAGEEYLPVRRSAVGGAAQTFFRKFPHDGFSRCACCPNAARSLSE